MKKILIITEEPFGYQTDFYNWCYYLKEEYEITYLCFDSDLPLKKLAGVKIVRVNRNGCLIRRELNYFRMLKRIIQLKAYDNYIVTNNLRSSIVKFYTKKRKVIHDIRTVAVYESYFKRLLMNLNWFIGTRLYSCNTIISDKIYSFYKIPHNRYYVLPLGANIFSYKNKNFDTLHLLYIGVIRPGFEETLKGFASFALTQPESTYTIIGFKDFCSLDTVEILKKTINDLDLHKNVKFLGRKTHDECFEFFEKCNVGVSYIPILPKFDNQPPTKNYEYLLSGMVCIATATTANQKHINNLNGVIIKDNAQSFEIGLKNLYLKRSSYNSALIRETQLDSQWKNIVNNIFKPILIKYEN